MQNYSSCQKALYPTLLSLILKTRNAEYSIQKLIFKKYVGYGNYYKGISVIMVLTNGEGIGLLGNYPVS